MDLDTKFRILVKFSRGTVMDNGVFTLKRILEMIWEELENKDVDWDGPGNYVKEVEFVEVKE